MQLAHWTIPRLAAHAGGPAPCLDATGCGCAVLRVAAQLRVLHTNDDGLASSLGAGWHVLKPEVDGPCSLFELQQ